MKLNYEIGYINFSKVKRKLQNLRMLIYTSDDDDDDDRDGWLF